MTSNSGPGHHVRSFFPRLAISAFLSVVLIGCYAGRADAQWNEDGNNINNTNTGNVGIGTTTPNAKLVVIGDVGLGSNDIESWTLQQSVIESLNTSIFFGQTRDLHLLSNAYHNSGWKYKGGGFGAANFYLHNGAHYWRVGATGTADSLITWNDAMTLDNSGNLGLGTTAPGSWRLAVTGATENTFPNGPALMKLQSSSAFDANVGPGINFSGAFNASAATTFALISGVKENVTSGNYAGRLVFGTRTNGAGAVDMTRMVIDSTGRVGIGTTSPGYRLDVQGGAFNSSGGLCIAGDCKTAWSQVTGTPPWSTSGSNIYYNTGKVSVGTATPGFAKVHIYSGASAATEYIGAGNPELTLESSSATELIFLSPDTGSGRIWFSSPASNLAGGILYAHNSTLANGFMKFNAGGNFTRMTILGDGNVGIGTTDPKARLDVASTASTVLAISRDDGTVAVNDPIGTIDFRNNDANLTTQNVFGSIQVKASYSVATDAAAGHMTFATTGTAAGGSPVERMRIDAAGNIGIGTVSPGASYRLDVSGSINSSGLCLAGDCKTAWSQVGGGGGNSLWEAGAGSTIYYSAGNVGIGTSSPAQMFHVHSSGTFAGTRTTTAATGSTINDGVNFGYENTSGAYVWNREASPVILATNNTERLRIDSSGKVGIGTTAPAGRLDVRQNSGTLATLLTSYGANEDAYLRGGTSAAVIHIGDVTSTTSKVLLMENGGTVGVGTASPNTSYKLDVNGNTNVTGNINLTGTINAKYQDVAEWVPSTHALPAGTVVTLDPTKNNHVEASSKSYDTRVAGVVSAQPGIALGEEGHGKVLVATTGRVRIKVDASHGPIQVGDLLVTSSVPGVAMKSQPIDVSGVQIHRPGTLIGKALEPLARGRSEILVLLSLQ